MEGHWHNEAVIKKLSGGQWKSSAFWIDSSGNKSEVALIYGSLESAFGFFDAPHMDAVKITVDEHATEE